MITIREASDRDAEAIWRVVRDVLAGGDTYALAPDTSRADALAYWFAPEHRVYVASSQDEIVGTYFLTPNQPGLGSHVANAAFVVASAAQGRGTGRAMGEHAMGEARRLGYRAMQFNFVVATNRAAVELWQRLGFRIIGTLPAVFRHLRLGFVDAHVMFRELGDDGTGGAPGGPGQPTSADPAAAS